MTTMTDLTKERLDALERFVRGEDEDEGTAVSLHPDLLLALIAMARGKQRAERERDAYVALADAKAAEATALGRERDALLDAIVHADLDSVAEVLRDVIIGDSCEGNCECVIHGLDRLRAVFEAALAQPTAEGGE